MLLNIFEQLIPDQSRALLSLFDWLLSVPATLCYAHSVVTLAMAIMCRLFPFRHSCVTDNIKQNKSNDI